MKIFSPITFFYYEDIEAAASFYQDVMGLKLVEDQKWAKIFQISPASFMGVVDGSKGFHQTQPKNAVLLTFVVDDVKGWHAYLKEKGVKILREPKFDPEIQVESLFFEDPGGYSLEAQRFHKPELDRLFQG